MAAYLRFPTGYGQEACAAAPFCFWSDCSWQSSRGDWTRRVSGPWWDCIVFCFMKISIWEDLFRAFDVQMCASMCLWSSAPPRVWAMYGGNRRLHTLLGCGKEANRPLHDSFYRFYEMVTHKHFMIHVLLVEHISNHWGWFWHRFHTAETLRIIWPEASSGPLPELCELWWCGISSHLLGGGLLKACGPCQASAIASNPGLTCATAPER